MLVSGDEFTTHADLETAVRKSEKLLNVINRTFHERSNPKMCESLLYRGRNDVNFQSCLRAFLLRQCLFVVEGMFSRACSATHPLVTIELSRNWLDDEGASTRHAAGASRAATAVLDAGSGFRGSAN